MYPILKKLTFQEKELIFQLFELPLPNKNKRLKTFLRVEVQRPLCTQSPLSNTLALYFIVDL